MYNTNTNIFTKYYYFDANGTTPLYSGALEAYENNAYLGNSSAIYADEAKAIIKNAENILKGWCNAPDAKIIFNSGASEGNNHIFYSFAHKDIMSHFIISALEHNTSIKCAEQLRDDGKIELTFIYPNIYGLIDPIDVLNNIKSNTNLISIMSANNETGSIMPFMEISEIAKQHNIVFHSDAVQYIGKYPIDMRYGPDIITGSFHKFHGPQGLGFIICNCPSKLTPMIYGSQFYGLRGGTENIPAIAGATEAMKYVFNNRLNKNQRMVDMKQYILQKLKIYDKLPFEQFVGKSDDYVIYGNGTPICIVPLSNKSVANTLTISFIKRNVGLDKKFCNIVLRDALFKDKCIVSIGSACHTASKSPSHVLTALRLPFIIRAGVIRISMHDMTSWSHIKHFVKKLIKRINEQKYKN